MQAHTMTSMQVLRNRRFRRWVACGLAVTWLFTVLTCAVDTDAVAAEPTQASQLASPVQSGPAHNHDGDTQDDPCCQSQSNAVVSFNAVKLPQVNTLAVLVPLALLLMFTLPFTLLGVTVAPDRDSGRRRFEFLVHSLQAQAPPV